MSFQIPIDPMLDAPADDVWRGLVFQFLQLYPPAAINAASQDTLGNLAAGYLATSHDINMQALVVVLDSRYNLVGRGLIDAGLMHAINTNVANHRAVTPQQPPPAPMQPAAPSNTTNDTPAIPPAPSQPPTLPPPQSQPILRLRRKGFLGLKWRQKEWDHVCDLCGYKTGCRGDFARHMKLGAQRAGFMIYKVDPLNDPHWYATDEAGTTYIGDVVRSTRDTEKENRNRRILPPCGPRIQEADRPRREKYRKLNGDKIKEKSLARRKAAKLKGEELAGKDAEQRHEEGADIEDDSENGSNNDSKDDDEAEEWR